MRLTILVTQFTLPPGPLPLSDLFINVGLFSVLALPSLSVPDILLALGWKFISRRLSKLHERKSRKNVTVLSRQQWRLTP